MESYTHCIKSQERLTLACSRVTAEEHLHVQCYECEYEILMKCKDSA